MSENRGLLAKVNDSDKQRGILPETAGHTADEDAGWVEKAKQHKWKIVAVVAVLLVALILGLVLGSKGSNPQPTPPGPTPGPEPIDSGYNLYYLNKSDIQDSKNMATGVLTFNSSRIHQEKFLERATKAVEATNGTIKLAPTDIPVGINNEYIEEVRFEFSQVDYKVTKILFTDNKKQRFSIPSDVVGSMGTNTQMSTNMAGFSYRYDPFGFEFRSTRSADVINVDTTNSDFMMTDKFMQIDLQVPSTRIYGLGERTREFSLAPGTWTMWSNGRPTPYDDGTGGLQTYGVHPFALIQTPQKDEWMGIFFRNANAQSPIITYKDGSNATLTYVTTGGELEMYFFVKGNAKEIIAAYHNLIGKPSLPPLWSLGWQFASYDYENLTKYDEVIKGYDDAGIPFEGVFFDIPYMKDFADFSVDTTAFPDLKNWTSSTLQAKHKKLTLIIDAALSAEDPENEYYNKANQDKALIASTAYPQDNRGWLMQKLWPGKAVFLDFFNQTAIEIWKQGLNDLWNTVPYDGIWLDLNEASGDCNGECGPALPNKTETASAASSWYGKFESLWSAVQDDGNSSFTNNTWYKSYDNQGVESTYNLPFSPGPDILTAQLLSLNATHMNGEREYNLHSLFGHRECMATHEVFSNSSFNTQSPRAMEGLRTFILSRSTFAGSGRYAQHWLGDNHRDWENMRWSIAGTMNFNMFGIPMVGPDTCGFYKSDKVADLTGQRQLCARWIQLATFYPFARQHHDKTTGNGHGGPPLEPYTLAGPTANSTEYMDMAKKAIIERFSYVRHMYTCLFRVSQEGGSCYDPMMYHYPTDDVHFMQNNTEHTFLVGDALKVTPVLKANATELWSYFPNGEWVSMRNFTNIVTAAGDASAGEQGQWISLPIADTSEGIHSHLRPGYMVPYQTCGNKTCETTTDLQTQGELSMIINPDAQGHAKGRLFLNADDTIAELEQHTYEYYEFQLGAKSIKKWNLNPSATKPAGNALGIKEFVITNAANLQDTDYACWASETDNSIHMLSTTADATKKTLTIHSSDGSALQPMDIKNIYFGDSTKDMVGLCRIEPTPSENANNMSAYYTPKTPPALTSNTEVVTLTNSLPQYPDLNLTLSVVSRNDSQPHLRVEWKYSNPSAFRPAFEVPTDIIVPLDLVQGAVLSNYVKYTANATGPFTLDVMNAKGTVYYTIKGDMQLMEYLNVINGVAHTYADAGSPDAFKGVMGIFEQTASSLFLGDGVYSLWSRDEPNPVQTTKAPGANMYGTHPFLMAKATDGTWFGQFTNLAAAQDWWIKNDASSGDVAVSTYGAGGVADMYFFVGANPDELTKAYHSIIGRPVMTPQWALGWHQCRWGYNTTKALEDVVDGFISNKLPLETQWSDIDYMDSYKDFTVDPVNFAGLGEFVNKIQTNYSMKYIPIVDAGVAQRLPSIDNYAAYNAGTAVDAFLLAGSDNKTIFTGQVWAVDAAFPDWFAQKAGDYWRQMFSDFHKMVGFNGVWLDMNEASNMLCTGTCYDDQKAAKPVQNNLPYIPTGRDLEAKAISLDAVHADGTIELDAHSLYGTMEVHNTHKWFEETQKERTMIISRSSYAGMGKYGSRWLGDNFSSAEYMAYSVTGVMGNNLAGITLAGSDICGFIGNTTAELCGRWYTLGAYYPFSRNHNGWNNAPQEPWLFNTTVIIGSTTIQDVIQDAMYKKLHIIRYLYTQMSLIQEEGGSYFRPLFYDFPDDTGAYQDQELNVMLGPSLKLSVQSGALSQSSTDFYFPAGKWCDVYCKADQGCCMTQQTGGKVTLQTLYAFQAYLHIREGHIVPMQNATDLGKHPYQAPSNTASEEVKAGAHDSSEAEPAGYEANNGYVAQMTTSYLQQNQTDFHISPSCNATKCVASGKYINDDGLTLDVSQRNTYTLTYEHDVVAAPASPASMTVTIKTSGLQAKINANDLLNKIEIYDATAFAMNAAGVTYSVSVNFNAATQKSAQSLGTATWADRGDKLEILAPNHFAPASSPILLTEVDTIVFTKQ